MQLSEHFTLEEMIASTTAKSKGIDNTPTQEAVENLRALCINVLEPLRVKYGKPIHVNSGYRCPKLNKAVGGSTTSQHCGGFAADIDCGSVTENKKLWNLLHDSDDIEYDQLIDEANLSWIHVSYKSSGKNRHQNLAMVKKNGKSTYISIA